ncbi:hypothetical protein NE542_04870 [Faecalibacillus intestinalis]|jgi:uncharacterized protein (UPF0335 family)|uniref:Sensor histidine kinase NatK C-terminal domain-containing protein n=1 Tax=Faecalibacillus intestinalis TaxID=1982626 RepID=A0AAP2UDX6_9FIRM|nr:hypothetical protein [Faecalibacillus intestinalis]RHR92310.1 hypothetical protein DWW38_01110 [Coprobacillus sp. AF15-30]MCB8591650.1 hypothetical protein [Faecalibacillus intestinalis]MCB8612400.1 hypothetical protein [Faecalibacillus intestinalis]MCG4680070.1 hypothetical protein [Faecalibacillus intestinalis]MCG4713112.1 hypothetical protein [Faecalibacillus intestinalis]
MFIEFILRMIENILLAYFLGYFLNVENKKDYVLKLSLLGTIFSFFHFSTFFYLGSLFLMHFIFLEYIQKQRRIEHVLYSLLLVLILFVCNCYSESLYSFIRVQNTWILQLFQFLSKILFGGVCLFIDEVINSKKDVFHVFKETIIFSIIVLFIFIFYIFAKQITNSLLDTYTLFMIAFFILLICLFIFLYFILIKESENRLKLERVQLQYQSYRKNASNIQRLHQEIMTKEHRMIYVLKKIENMTNENNVHEFIDQEIETILNSSFLLNTQNEIFDDLISDCLNDFRRKGYDFKVICSIKGMKQLDYQENIQKIIQFIEDVFKCSNKKLTISIKEKNECVIVKVVSKFNKKLNYFYLREDQYESYSIIIKQ